MKKRPGKILVVDDDPELLGMLPDFLKVALNDFEVYSAESADEALKIIGRNKRTFKLVITDLAMPKKNGIQMIREMREMGIKIPVILMSGLLFENLSVEDARMLGVICFLKKPATKEEIKKAVIGTIRIATEIDHSEFVYVEVTKDGSQKFSCLTNDYELLETVSRRDKEEKKKDEEMWGCISNHTVCPLGKKIKAYGRRFPCAHCSSWFGEYPRNLTLKELIGEISYIRAYNNLGVSDPLHVGLNGIGDATLNPNTYLLLENPPCNVSFRVSTPGITIPFPDFISVNNPLEYFVDRERGNSNLRVFQGSLMGPTDEVRNKIIRIGELCPIKDLLKYGIRWATENDKLFYLNYVMIRGINDRPEHAAQLVNLVKDLPVLIKITKFMSCNGLLPSLEENVKIFTSILSEYEIQWIGFLPKGADVTGCGMLGSKLH